MKIRPCIDIHNGTVKQIVGGTLKDGSGRESGSARENFVAKEDARYYASLYKEKGLGGGHIILLNSVKEEEAYLADKKQAFAALKAFPGGMQAGGGITPVTAGGFLEAGASHVIVTSYVFRDGRLSETALKEMIRAVGTKRLVLDLSCRRRQDGRYVVVTDRWQKYTDLVVNEQTLDRLKDYCDEFLIHAADAEGKRSGIETGIVSILGRWQKESGFPITYAGGVHSEEDLAVIRELSGGSMDVTVGSALTLFGGNLSLDELVRMTKEEAGHSCS